MAQSTQTRKELPAAESSQPNRGGINGDKQKFLYRSNSSRLYKRPKAKIKLDHDLDKIYFISSNKDDEFYDSIDVIDERRSSNFKKTGGVGGFCRSSTVIYSEYCSGSSILATPDAGCSDVESKIINPKDVKFTTDGDGINVKCIKRGDNEINTEDKTMGGGHTEVNQTESLVNQRSADNVDGIEVDVMEDVGNRIGNGNRVMVEDGRHTRRNSSSSDEDHNRDSVSTIGRLSSQTTITVRADIEDCGGSDGRNDGNGEGCDEVSSSYEL